MSACDGILVRRSGAGPDKARRYKACGLHKRTYLHIIHTSLSETSFNCEAHEQGSMGGVASCLRPIHRALTAPLGHGRAAVSHV
eukprot:scaffold312803_cov32-Tisochrysis_lutea.AAC.4